MSLRPSMLDPVRRTGHRPLPQPVVPVAVRLRQLVTAGSPGDGDYVDQVELEVHIIREGFRNGDKGVGNGQNAV